MIAEGIETEAQLQRLIEMRLRKGTGDSCSGARRSADEAGAIIRAAVGGRSAEGREVQRHDASSREP